MTLAAVQPQVQPRRTEVAEAEVVVEGASRELVPAGVLAPTMGIERAIAALAELRQFVERVMIPNVDYGPPYPGAPADKKGLLEPGANKLCFWYGLRPDPTPVSVTMEYPKEPTDTGFFDFTYKVDLIRVADGRVVCSAVANCNSMEPKYRYKKVYGGSQGQKTLNMDLPSLVNTMIAMAIKRAYVRATRMSTQASGIFDPGRDEGVRRQRRQDPPPKQQQHREVSTDDVLSIQDMKPVGEAMRATGKTKAELIGWLREQNAGDDPLAIPTRLKEDLLKWATQKTENPESQS